MALGCSWCIFSKNAQACSKPLLESVECLGSGDKCSDGARGAMPSNISSPRYLPVLVVSLYGPRKEVTAQFASTLPRPYR